MVAPKNLEEVMDPIETPTSRVIFSTGGKGGVGKTSVMVSLVGWFDSNGIPAQLLDLDTENKARGSLSHFYKDRAPKINIHTPAGLDAFVDYVSEGAPIIIADMGAGSGQVTTDWFDSMYQQVAEAGIVFTAIGVITDDPASVESVLTWASKLQGRVSYIIVKNALTNHAEFNYWENSREAHKFREIFNPSVIQADFRLAELENASRNHGATLEDIANRRVEAPELRKASLVMRAQSYRHNIFSEFDRVKEYLLP
jgi:MinD-like ATPase involved in chromosome partitioning or flagellar assembly